MAKLKNPLLSFGAKGRLGKLFSLAKRQGQHILERRPIPTDAKSPAQLFNRHMFTKCVDLWHLLSEAERQEWESLARPRHMTGYAWFISQCLRPNPGIYLPLQGGRMEGGIDMAKNWIRNVRKPLDAQEPVTKEYFEDNLPPGAYTEGARVTHSAHQTIPTASSQYLAFDSDRYDTDNIHDPITNNSRLTCKTAGIYLITACIVWFDNATGHRILILRLNRVFPITEAEASIVGTAPQYQTATTIFGLIVGDYVEAQVWQNSGGPLDVRRNVKSSPEFMMQRIG